MKKIVIKNYNNRCVISVIILELDHINDLILDKIISATIRNNEEYDKRLGRLLNRHSDSSFMRRSLKKRFSCRSEIQVWENPVIIDKKILKMSGKVIDTLSIIKYDKNRIVLIEPIKKK